MQDVFGYTQKDNRYRFETCEKRRLRRGND